MTFSFPSLHRLLQASVLAAFTVSALAGAHGADAYPRYRFNVPPSAELHYVIKSRQSGIPLEGSAVIQWTIAGNRFSLATQARAALLGKILDSKSEGVIDNHGLAPSTFTEHRFRRTPTITTFDRASGIIRFSASDQTYRLQGGEQDRNSAVWQLVSVARAMAAKFKPGSEWTFFVAGQRDADPWVFKVVKLEKIRTPLGELNAMHILKDPQPDSKEQKVELWLGPQQEWYPVRVRYTDTDGDFIEQTLERVTRKAP
jgi:hypothetical protein